MEKIVTEQITTQLMKHQFFCDKCSEFLGEAEEHNDGFYERLGAFEQSFAITGATWYDEVERYFLKKCYCEKCKESTKDEIRKFLLGIGFERA